MIARQQLARVALTALACSAMSCVGQPAMVAPQLPRRDKVVDSGPAQGSACGLLLFNVLPLGLNHRASRAYGYALSAAKAVALTDTSIQDRWYFVLIGTVLCCDVSGRAVRNAPSDQTNPQ